MFKIKGRDETIRFKHFETHRFAGNRVDAMAIWLSSDKLVSMFLLGETSGETTIIP